MKKADYAYWTQMVEDSRFTWKFDPIFEANQGLIFAYKGGPEKGVFVNIDKNGIAECGTYEGAFGSISDAVFSIKHRRDFLTQAVAVKVLSERIGASFFLEFSTRQVINKRTSVLA